MKHYEIAHCDINDKQIWNQLLNLQKVVQLSKVPFPSFTKRKLNKPLWTHKEIKDKTNQENNEFQISSNWPVQTGTPFHLICYCSSLYLKLSFF